MLSQFDLQSDEVIDRVKSQEVSVRASYEYMLLNLLGLKVTNRDGTAHGFLLHGNNATLLSKRVQVEDIDLLVRSIAE